jgi:5-methylcytosine-specific restriction enzyme subunit McrC
MSHLEVIEIAEHRTRVATGISRLSAQDRVLAEELRAAGGGRLIVDEAPDGVYVSSTEWVGVVRFDNFEVQVRPKLAGGNVGVVEMLDYAAGLRSLRETTSLRTLDAKGASLLDLLFWLFADECDRIIRNGALQDYVRREEALNVLRGSLRINDQVRRRYGRIDILECDFEEFESDIFENRALLAALQLARSVVRDGELQRRIRRLHSVFAELASLDGFEASRARQEFNPTRRNRHYEPALQLAFMILDQKGIRDLFGGGSLGSFAFLIDMNLLFEQFATRLVAESFEPLGFRVRPQHRQTGFIVDMLTGRNYAAIVPDILIESTNQGQVTSFPVDAKYKRYDTRKIDPADLYQALFYAYAYADALLEDRQPQAVILYPRDADGRDVWIEARFQQRAAVRAFAIDIPDALKTIRRGRVTVRDVPALDKLHEVVRNLERLAPGAMLPRLTSHGGSAAV